MSNLTVVFTAKNNLVSGVAVDDEIKLELNATEFMPSSMANKKTNTMMSGRDSSVKFFNAKSWSISVNDRGVVTLQDTTTTSLTMGYMNMFLGSVDNGEQFTITDMDNGDEEVDVKLSGDWSSQRITTAVLSTFSFTFTVRKVI